MDIWTALTEAQATVLAALLTIVAAGLGVLLGARLFDKKVKSFREALETSRVEFESHLEQIQSDLDGKTQQFGLNLKEELDERIADVLKRLNEVGNTITDRQDRAEATPAEEQPKAATEDNWDWWYSLQSDWNAIRDRIEAIASQEETDGRFRRRYGRIDRRRFADLIDALGGDGLLGGDTARFKSALALWQTYKSGKKPLAQADLNAMRNLKSSLLSEPILVLPANTYVTRPALAAAG